MASGMPVVGTRHAGIRELVEDGVSGWLVPERDEAALAAALARLAAEPERWAAMGRAGRAKVEREYDIHRLNDRFAGMLQTLIRPEATPMTSFADMLAAGYGFTDPAITLGAALEGGAVHPEPKVRGAGRDDEPPRAGGRGDRHRQDPHAQLLAEQLSAHGVPVFVADIKVI